MEELLTWWERATTLDGPWVPVPGYRVPKRALRKAAKPTWNGGPIVAYRYWYRRRQHSPDAVDRSSVYDKD
jgi:hypothetical protein